MRSGDKLASEAFGPAEPVPRAVLAERAGFDVAEISDHFHPWLDNQGHSPFTWTVLGSIAAKTGSIGPATGAACPTVRHHRAAIAQPATLALLSDGRFVLGVGSGERLDEHVVGPGLPEDVRTRHELPREALDIIRLLWTAGYRGYEGGHLRVEDARIFDLSAEPPLIAVAASGPPSARMAAELGDGLFASEAKPEIVRHYREAGGAGPVTPRCPWRGRPTSTRWRAPRRTPRAGR